MESRAVLVWLTAQIFSPKQPRRHSLLTKLSCFCRTSEGQLPISLCNPSPTVATSMLDTNEEVRQSASGLQLNAHSVVSRSG